jgi:hypothetical protein
VSPAEDQAPRTEDLDEAARFTQEEFVPVAEKLTERYMAKAVPMAREEGWEPELAEAIGTIGAVSFLGKMIEREDPEEAFAASMKEARREVLRGLFKKALEDGADRRSAFLKMVGVVRENSLRASEGAEEETLPDDWIAAALMAVDAAAEQGLPADQQANAGLERLSELNLAAEVA